jgi:hypothetical protein
MSTRHRFAVSRARFDRAPRAPAMRGAIALAAALALGGCATYGAPGGYGGYGYPGQGGYGGSPYGNAYAQVVVGTVVGVDRGYNRIVLVRDDGYGARGGQVSIQYDGRTHLGYRGRQYPVDGLERGDVVRVEGTASGGRMIARRIEVLRNVRESGYPGGYGYPGGGPGGYYPDDPGHGLAEFRGRVAFVDRGARVIRIDGAGYGRGGEVRYAPNATVRWQGENHPARNLDPGDVVRVQARRSGNAWFAERLWLESNRGR